MWTRLKPRSLCQRVYFERNVSVTRRHLEVFVSRFAKRKIKLHSFDLPCICWQQVVQAVQHLDIKIISACYKRRLACIFHVDSSLQTYWNCINFVIIPLGSRPSTQLSHGTVRTVRPFRTSYIHLWPVRRRPLCCQSPSSGRWAQPSTWRPPGVQCTYYCDGTWPGHVWRAGSRRWRPDRARSWRRSWSAGGSWWRAWPPRTFCSWPGRRRCVPSSRRRRRAGATAWRAA